MIGVASSLFLLCLIHTFDRFHTHLFTGLRKELPQETQFHYFYCPIIVTVSPALLTEVRMR